MKDNRMGEKRGFERFHCCFTINLGQVGQLLLFSLCYSTCQVFNADTEQSDFFFHTFF